MSAMQAPEADVLATYVDQFETCKALRGDEPRWLVDLREQAFREFHARGFPDDREEAWQFTSLKAFKRQPYRFDASPGRLVADPNALVWEGWGRLVFVDGRFAPEFSEPGTPEGVRLATLSRSIVDHSETVRTHLCAQNGPASLPFATLNTAFFLDGAMVKVEPKTQVERPLHVLFVTTPGGGPRATASRLLIVAGAGSRVRLVEEHAGVGDGEGFACAVTEIAVLEDARVEHVRLQNEGPGAVHIGTVSARVGRHGRYVSRAISLGARLARIEIDVTLEGEGAECELDGLYVASDRQHVDHHTRIDHVSPHTTSRELYKGVLGGKATGVFNGRVVVREGASKTEAVQANHNLLLSDHALVNTNPELEILTDDVVARHGATIGQLDPEQMFYLRSRGIATPEARTILIDGFAGEIIQRVRMTPLVERLAAILARRF